MNAAAATPRRSKSSEQTMCIVSIGEFDDFLIAVPTADAPAILRAFSRAVQVDREYSTDLKFPRLFRTKREFVPMQIKRIDARILLPIQTHPAAPATPATPTDPT